jgi:hypothetical protein
MRSTLLAFLSLPLFLAARPAHAQGPGSWEFGMDTGINVAFIDDIDETFFTVGVPATTFGTIPKLIAPYGGLLQNWRIAYQAGESMSLEVPLGFSLAGTSYDTFWRLGGGLGFLFNLPRSNDAEFFFSTGGLINVYGADSVTESQFGLQAGVGVRLFLGKSWALRPQVGGARMFETEELFGSWNVIGSIGLSFFTQPAGE